MQVVVHLKVRWQLERSTTDKKRCSSPWRIFHIPFQLYSSQKSWKRIGNFIYIDDLVVSVMEWSILYASPPGTPFRKSVVAFGDFTYDFAGLTLSVGL